LLPVTQTGFDAFAVPVGLKSIMRYMIQLLYQYRSISKFISGTSPQEQTDGEMEDIDRVAAI